MLLLTHRIGGKGTETKSSVTTTIHWLQKLLPHLLLRSTLHTFHGIRSVAKISAAILCAQVCRLWPVTISIWHRTSVSVDSGDRSPTQSDTGRRTPPPPLPVDRSDILADSVDVLITTQLGVWRAWCGHCDVPHRTLYSNNNTESPFQPVQNCN